MTELQIEKIYEIKNRAENFLSELLENERQLNTNNKILNNKVFNNKEDIEKIVNVWNELPSPIPNIQKVTGNRKKHLECRLQEYGIDAIIETIKNISKSNFLKGNNQKGWFITFDWFIKESNFKKVYEGNYVNKKNSNQLQSAPTYDLEQIKKQALENTEI